MNVANLELCRELYELSGWEEIGLLHHPYHYEPHEIEISAYDLGYLLRKLPHNSRVVKVQGGYAASSLVNEEWESWAMDSPEDAACKLAIELFKKGVLEKTS